MTITATGDRLEVHQDPSAAASPVNPDASSAAQPEGAQAGVAEIEASARPTFTITDAAAACSVSRKTITRKLPELASHGAAKDDDGVWRIPVEALLAVGLHPGRSLPTGATSPARPVAPTPVPARPTELDTVTIPRDRWDDVRIRLARAEAEAAERGLALADARLALRALTAGPMATRAVSVPGDDHSPIATADGSPLAPSRGMQTTDASAEAHPGQDEAALGRAAASAPPSELPRASVPDLAGTSTAAPPETTDVVPADIVAARNLAARTGGYVPAGTVSKKRRWWQSR